MQDLNHSIGVKMNFKFSIFFFAASVFFCPSFGQPEPLKSHFKSIVIAVDPFKTSLKIFSEIQAVLESFHFTSSGLCLKHFSKDGPAGIWVAEQSNMSNGTTYKSSLIKKLYLALLENEKELRKQAAIVTN